MMSAFGFASAAAGSGVLRELCVVPRTRTQDGTPQTHPQSKLHSPTPASAIIVSKIRFNPNSRPLESNHSCKVCAPPPDPPPPMAIASCPRESGIFASVDARCTCAALASCESTARTTCKIRAPARNSPAGRFPITTTSQLTPGRPLLRGRPHLGGHGFIFHRAIQRQAQRLLQALHLGHRRRADIDFHAGRLGNRIHRSPAANHSNVERSLRRGWNRSRRKGLDRLRQNHNGIGRAKIAPRVPARSAHDHFKPAAAQGFGHDRVRACSVEHEAVSNRIFPARRRKNVPHAAQVAFALFAHISDKHKRQRMPDANVAQQRRNRQQRRHACTVVGNPRPVDAASLLADIQRCVRRKHGVNMRTQRHIAPSKSGMDAEDVAHIVDANIVQSDFAKALRQPGRRAPTRQTEAPESAPSPFASASVALPACETS